MKYLETLTSEPAPIIKDIHNFFFTNQEEVSAVMRYLFLGVFFFQEEKRGEGR
jgi:hypothetical protein